MSGIGLVINPRAGANRRDPSTAARLARQLGDRGVVAMPHSLEELAKAAEDFRRQKIDVLGIAGGDGTNYVTLTHFHEVYGSEPLPTVAFLRGGTMNTVANSLRLPGGQPEGLLDRLVRRYMATPRLPVVEQRTMNIEGKLGFLWGIGVIPAYLREYYDTGAPSPWTAAKTLARGIVSAAMNGAMIRRMTEPVWVEVELGDGERWPMQPYLCVGAGTIPDIGLGFQPYYLAGRRPGSFHIQGVTASPLGFVADLPRIHRAAPMKEGKAIDRLTHQAVVRSSTGKIAYMIDGDLLEHPGPEMTVRLGPVVRIATMNLRASRPRGAGHRRRRAR
jgi:diacylglycerol kinase family enzyme